MYANELICSFVECEKPVTCKGLCNGHYTQKRKGQELKPLRKLGIKTCNFPECGRAHFGHGLCSGHLRQQKKNQILQPLGYKNIPTECNFHDCTNIAICIDLCSTHYGQQRNGKNLTSIRKNRLDKSYSWQDQIEFVLKNIKTTTNDMGCILIDSTGTNGYGTVKFEGKRRLAHRVAMAASLGSFEALGSEAVHHKCSNRACINIAHLQLVTQAENTAEMLARQAYIDRIASLEAEIIKLQIENNKLRILNG